MALIEFIDKAMLEAIENTRALIIIDSLFIDAFANVIDSLNTKINSSKLSIHVLSILNLQQLACMAYNDNEQSLTHLMKQYNWQRQIENDEEYRADLDTLNLINLLNDQNLNQKMISNINSLIIVNELSQVTLNRKPFKQKISDAVMNYFTTERKRIISISTQQGKGYIQELSNFLDQGNSKIILDPFNRGNNVVALMPAQEVIQ